MVATQLQVLVCFCIDGWMDGCDQLS